MYERFSDRARKVMQLANQQAQRFGHAYIGTEHVLLGLVEEGTGVTANVLRNLSIDLRKIRTEVEKIIQTDPVAASLTPGKLPLAVLTKWTMEKAIAAARDLGHNYVGTEHMLLGLLDIPESLACTVLHQLGVSTQTVRQEVLRMLGSTEAPHTAPNPAPHTDADTWHVAASLPTSSGSGSPPPMASAMASAKRHLQRERRERITTILLSQLACQPGFSDNPLYAGKTVRRAVALADLLLQELDRVVQDGTTGSGTES